MNITQLACEVVNAAGAGWCPIAAWHPGGSIPRQVADVLVSLACLAASLYLWFGGMSGTRKGPPRREVVWMIASLFLVAAGASLPYYWPDGIDSLADEVALGMGALSCVLVLTMIWLDREPEPTGRLVGDDAVSSRYQADRAVPGIGHSIAQKMAMAARQPGDAIVIMDAALRINWVNEGYTRITGYRIEDMIGRPWDALLQRPHGRSKSHSLIKPRVNLSQQYRTEVTGISKAGRRYWMAVEVQPIHDELGRPVNIMALASDITERKRSERRVEMQNTSMRILAASSRPDEALEKLLPTMGELLDCDVAEFWTLDPATMELRSASPPWASRRVSKDWTSLTAGRSLSSVGGLAGKAWTTRCACWSSNLAASQGEDEGVQDDEAAARHGLRSGFSVPVIESESGPVVGVLTFLTREPLPRDETLLQIMTSLAHQIGLFIERPRAQAELAQVNAQLNALLKAATEVSIIATDPQGIITVFNSGAERMLGYEASEMVNKATPVLLHDPEEVQAHAAALTEEFGSEIQGFSVFAERARRGGRDVREWTYIRKDGTRLTVLLAVTAVFDPEGHIRGFLGIATDLTIHKRVDRELRASEFRLRRLVEANILGVVFGDIEGNVTDANDAFLDMIGYTRQEMSEGQLPWKALITPEAQPMLGRCRLELKRRGFCSPFELECRRKDGRSLPVMLGVALLDESQPARSGSPIVAFCLDVSVRKRLEDQLRDHARELADADLRKNQFLAMLGHELRNPLAPIRNAVKIMKQRGSDDPALCWARDVIDRQMSHMTQLVDDLLEISRVTRGKVRLQKEVIDVTTIVSYALETSRPVIDLHRHRLSIALPSQPVMVHADSIRIAQVLSNLLNNAAKYTPEGGAIRLAVTVEDENVAFCVRDNGVGLPPEMLASVFDLFTQADRSLDRSEGGLGLGLTLVRSLVEMHGGKAYATSEGLGRGCEFWVKLPIWQPEASTVIDVPAPDAAPARAASRKSGPVTSRKVLVVDDNVATARSLELLLRLEGHNVQVVHEGTEAIKMLDAHHHEVVLMDIGLPGMTGYEVAQRIRSQPKFADVLLVAVTGYAEDEARRLSREAGFDYHLVKPVDPDGILALLASLEWDPAYSSSGGRNRPVGTEEVATSVFCSS